MKDGVVRIGRVSSRGVYLSVVFDGIAESGCGGQWVGGEEQTCKGSVER